MFEANFGKYPIRSSHNRRSMMSHRKLRCLSCCQHVRCREKTLSLLETSLGATFHLKRMPYPNLNALDVKDDETPRAKPRP
jgi:hypothetical protein